MVRRIVSFRLALLAGNMLAASPVLAADAGAAAQSRHGAAELANLTVS
jgi:hypothetical protein